jgi:hypothetical protein
MTRRALDLAKLIFDAEPDALAGKPEAIERVTEVLAKICGVLHSKTLAQDGKEALAEAAQKIARTVEREARETLTMVRLLEDDTGDPPDTIN